MRMQITSNSESRLRSTLDGYRTSILNVTWVSAIANVLALASSIYMMLVYDLVLPSKSVSTLLGLLVIVGVAYVFQAVFDLLRARMLSGIAAAFTTQLSTPVYTIMATGLLPAQSNTNIEQPLRDLDQVRSFLQSGGPAVLMDLPWVPIFLVVLSCFHIWLGLTALAGAVILLLITYVTERNSRLPALAVAGLTIQRTAAAEVTSRHRDAMRALGMRGRAEAAWMEVNRHYLAANQRLSDVSTRMGGLARIVRLLLQSAILTVGALLVISDKVTGGVIFASSILSSRALAPIDQSIANWKGFIAARQSWRRLDSRLAAYHGTAGKLKLPAPSESFAAEQVTVLPPGAQRPVVVDANFRLQPGSALSIIGPSASGKTSLVKALVGIWQPAHGGVRLDSATLDQWEPDDLGQHLGYLPQNAELIDGTIAQNIARFEPDAPDELVIAAARAAGIHELIVRFPQGYETAVGADGQNLSAGQRQRIALARALYRDPFLVVLDEPNSNLDADGETALVDAILKVRARRGIAIVVAHRSGVLDAVDLVLFMQDGRVRAFGPKDEVLARVVSPRQAITPQSEPPGQAE